jgi:hypothetical protein
VPLGEGVVEIPVETRIGFPSSSVSGSMLRAGSPARQGPVVAGTRNCLLQIRKSSRGCSARREDLPPAPQTGLPRPAHLHRIRDRHDLPGPRPPDTARRGHGLTPRCPQPSRAPAAARSASLNSSLTYSVPASRRKKRNGRVPRSGGLRMARCSRTSRGVTCPIAGTGPSGRLF